MLREKSSHVTLSLFRFTGAGAKWWAFTGMQLSHPAFRDVDGLLFYKLLGTGAGNGFSARADLGRYAFLASWDNEEDALRFFSTHEKIGQYVSRSDECCNIHMRPVKSHGKWGGMEPFIIGTEQLTPGSPVAVITRARIRGVQLLDFWRHVPSVSADVDTANGRLFSIGVGEWPWVEQATFSIWENFGYVKEFAYERKLHADVVRRTRERKWYSEELFARFIPFRVEGKFSGLDRQQLLGLGMECI